MLIIDSRPGTHEAVVDNDRVGPYPTEIHIVQALLKRGIDLRTFRCVDSKGSGFHCVSIWHPA